jgi:hypothetical protein
VASARLVQHTNRAMYLVCVCYDKTYEGFRHGRKCARPFLADAMDRVPSGELDHHQSMVWCVLPLGNTVDCSNKRGKRGLLAC